jgi:putative ABC transport system ATP-binding protein
MAEIVRCQQLGKRYGKVEVQALRDINLSVCSGEMLAIFGPSGSGKSTLLNIIGLLDSQWQGELLLFGQPCHGLNATSAAQLRRERMGFIFQSFNLLPELTAVENVEMALITKPLPKMQRRQQALAMLERVGMAHRAHHFPRQLSGGQQQRVGIARALVHQPALVLADEPTANLDSASAQEVIALMAQLAKHEQISFVFSTHDPRILQAVDRSIKLEDGVLQS